MARKRPMKPIGVRFEQDTLAKLEQISDRSQIEISNLVRMAVHRFLLQIEREGGLIIKVDDPPIDPHELVMNHRDHMK